MTDRTSVIFGNEIDKKTVKAAEKSKAKYIKKYGDDSAADYKISFTPIDALSDMGVRNVVFGDKNEPFAENALIVGNIRMGFGHYRISIAMASCAKALGFTPYWLDLLRRHGLQNDTRAKRYVFFGLAHLPKIAPFQ